VALHGPRTLESEAMREEAQARFDRAGIATFYSFESAAKVLNNMNQYLVFKKQRDEQI
ncbi:MAG: hypothetical protein GY866_22500, partial [Proteobacteria bacterium]|nr:hypothetical protein [Pseudomonadota bacterium]